MAPHRRITPLEAQECFQRLGISAEFRTVEARRLNGDQLWEGEGFLSFPIPEDNEALTVLSLRRALANSPMNQPMLHEHPWYLREPFGDLSCTPGWHSLAQTTMPSTIGQPIYYADSIKSDSLYLPSAAEVVLMLVLHFVLTGQHLLAKKHTWTRDRTKTGRFVTVGAFGKNGLFLSSHEVGYHSRGLGICPIVDPHKGVRR
jgi:hypothetical protein